MQSNLKMEEKGTLWVERSFDCRVKSVCVFNNKQKTENEAIL